MFKALIFSVISFFFASQANAQNIGIGTTNPLARLHVADSTVLFTGPTALNNNIFPPVSGQGVRMFWFPARAAFRAGYAFGSEWDRDSVGRYSFAAGYTSKAKGEASVAFGGSQALGYYSTAFGNSYSIGINSLASGSSYAYGSYSSSFGASHTQEAFSTAAGNSYANNEFATAVGASNAAGAASTATGFSVAKAFGGFSTGVWNDDTDNPPARPGTSTDRIFQLGNGMGDLNRSNALTVLRNGNMGVGVLLPLAKVQIQSNSTAPQLHINQMIPDDFARLRLTTASTRYWDIGGKINSSVTSSADRLNFYNSAIGDVLTITGDGRIGIANTNPSERLEVAGNIKATGTITPSDIRFKKSIIPLENSLSKILRLNGYSYSWKTEDFDNRGFDSTLQHGLLAQEVEKIFPEIVRTAADGYKGVDYTKLIPSLVEAIKEQQEQIHELKSEINELRAGKK